MGRRQTPKRFPESTLCCELHLNGRQETEAVYAFVDADWALTDTLTLKAGIRFSEEERDGRQAFDLTILPATPGGPPIRFAPEVAFFPNAVSDSRDGVQPDPFGFVVAPVEGPATFDATTPKIALEWEPDSDTLLYVSAQRGFKSGGYNIGSNQRTPFEPEDIWAYEAGLKSSLASNRLQFNAAGFFYDYTNLQAQDSIGNQPIIRNVGKATFFRVLSRRRRSRGDLARNNKKTPLRTTGHDELGSCARTERGRHDRRDAN